MNSIQLAVFQNYSETTVHYVDSLQRFLSLEPDTLASAKYIQNNFGRHVGTVHNELLPAKFSFPDDITRYVFRPIVSDKYTPNTYPDYELIDEEGNPFNSSKLLWLNLQGFIMPGYYCTDNYSYWCTDSEGIYIPIPPEVITYTEYKE